MSANKEAVISEKELSCRFGQEVLVGYAEPIRSSEYDNFDAFVDAVQREWDIQWKRIYSAEFSSGQTSLWHVCRPQKAVLSMGFRMYAKLMTGCHCFVDRASHASLLSCLQSAKDPLCFAVGEEMKVDELENREYPPAIKAAQIFVTGGTVLLFFAVLYWTLQAWAAFLSLFGSYKVDS